MGPLGSSFAASRGWLESHGWLVLYDAGFQDLSPAFADMRRFGFKCMRSRWLEEYTYVCGWDSVFDSTTPVTPIAGWALLHGIAPGQPFLVTLRHYSYRSYEGEWDEEVYLDLHLRFPLSREEHLRRWDRWLARV